MDSTVNYGAPTILKNEATAPASLTTSEQDVFVVKNGKDVKWSQLTVFGSANLSANTATFYYYLSFDGGTTWYPVSIYNTSTGEITARAVLVDSGTYASGGASLFADNVALGAANAFKVTGKCSVSTIDTYSISVSGRNN